MLNERERVGLEPRDRRQPVIIDRFGSFSQSEVEDFYRECNATFQAYFGIALKPQSINFRGLRVRGFL